MRIRVLWLGRPGAQGLEALVADYRKRTGRRWPAEDVRLKPVQGGRGEDPRRVLRAEKESILQHATASWKLIALDEHGEELSSPELAAMMRAFEDSGVPGLSFVIGSDLGLDPEIVRIASRTLSLSRLTLPHLLARLLLWEQLFRAADIVSGGGYHRRSIQWKTDGGSSR
ncbi:MAG: 23S rRNA (pseudouridine(1915)-N(3))-methyltransferase RlmH [Acidobacteria bacterium]|nr:23S rRNA (pseudouridine(1915)-N(3))-methyltransferase RlmH [Acidobacteriota bacterium]